jgi:pimeloyl-ACP methyl ester carboxylesterase
MSSFSPEVIEDGKGDTVVLIHGSASDRRTWDQHLREFASRYHVVSYSRRFHWPNRPISDGSDYSMGEHLEDLRSVVESLGGSPVHLVGHSYGAFLALLLAIEDPQIVRSLVLMEPPAITLWVSNDPKPLELLRLLFARPGAALALVKFGATGISPAKAAAKADDMDAAVKAFGSAVLGRGFFEKLSADRMEQVRINSCPAEFLGSGFSPLEEADIRRVRTPALLLSGRHSPALFRHLVRRLGELLPEAEVHTIPDASHIMHEDNPKAFRRAVFSFLEQQTISTVG